MRKRRRPGRRKRDETPRKAETYEAKQIPRIEKGGGLEKKTRRATMKKRRKG